MPPDAIPCFLLADFGTVDDQLRIVIFENNAELGEHSIRSVCVFCAAALPEAIAVACAGIEVSIGRIIGMDRCRLLHPPGGNDLLALINAVLRIAERKLCKILHREHQTPAADFHAHGGPFPNKAQGSPMVHRAAALKLRYGDAGNAHKDRAKHIDVFTHVEEHLPGSEIHGALKKSFIHRSFVLSSSKEGFLPLVIVSRWRTVIFSSFSSG